jgi:hypothetical protein
VIEFRGVAIVAPSLVTAGSCLGLSLDERLRQLVASLTTVILTESSGVRSRWKLLGSFSCDSVHSRRRRGATRPARSCLRPYEPLTLPSRTAFVTN